MEKLGLSSRNIIGRFYQTLEEELAGSWSTNVGMMFDSNQESETYKWLGQTPALREWIGGRQAKGLRSEGITIKNRTFEATLEIDVDDIRRDKTGQIMVRVDEMASRAAKHWESLMSARIVLGLTEKCYDGQYYFDVDHSEGDSGTQLNKLGATQVATLGVTSATAPTANEFADAIMGVIGYMYGWKDDQGEPINGSARAFLVYVPVVFWSAASIAVSANNLNTGTGVRDNPLLGAYKQGISIAVIADPRLTWTTTWCLFRTDGRAKPFIMQEEVAPQVSAIAEGSEEEFKNNRHLYGVKAIRNVGFGLWQHAAHCTFS